MRTDDRDDVDVLRERARRLSKKHQAYQAEVERLRVQLKAHEVELGALMEAGAPVPRRVRRRGGRLGGEIKALTERVTRNIAEYEAVMAQIEALDADSGPQSDDDPPA